VQPVMQLQPLFPLTFITGWSAARDVALYQYCIDLLPLTVEFFQVLDLLVDLLEVSPSWSNRVEREEQAEAAQAAIPAPVLSAPSVSSWEAVQLCLDSTDWWPVLQDLDVITALWSIHSGQASYTVDTLYQSFGPTLVTMESCQWFCFCWTGGVISAIISTRELCRASSLATLW